MSNRPPNLKDRESRPVVMTGPDFRHRLQSLGLSQAWLARALGKAPHTVGKWANGEMRVPEYVVFVLSLLATIQQTEKTLGGLHKSD